MEFEKQIRRTMVLIKNNIAFLLTVGTGIVYFLGFFKCFYILKCYKVEMSVVEIYSNINIFMSGLFLFMSLIMVPIVAYFIGLFIDSFYSVDKINVTTRFDRIFFSICPQLLISLFMLFVIIIINKFMLGYITKPNLFYIKLNQFLVYNVSDLLVLGFMLLVKIKNKHRKLIIGIIVSFIWCFMTFFMYGNEIDARIQNDPSSVYTINQDIISEGTITTNVPISDDSVFVENRGYITKGRLFSRRDNIYYWQTQDNVMYLIPENQIFYYSTED
nr:hypothetical protein [uncultured Anaerosporobacter sp.]